MKYVFISYLILLLLLVTLPLNSATSFENINIIQLRGDYFFHALAFLPWAFFNRRFKIKWLVWLIIGLVFATITESIQYLIPYRSWNVNDLIANGMGVMIGFLIARIVYKNKRVKIKAHPD